MSADQEGAKTVQDLIEASSLGTPNAQALRASISDAQAARAIARADELEQEEIRLKVIETPAEKLRRVAGLEGAPREELWEAIASAVININERMAVLEADADARRQVIDALQRRASAPLKGGTT